LLLLTAELILWLLGRIFAEKWKIDRAANNEDTFLQRWSSFFSSKYGLLAEMGIEMGQQSSCERSKYETRNTVGALDPSLAHGCVGK
jgi:hypothetical protein